MKSVLFSLLFVLALSGCAGYEWPQMPQLSFPKAAPAAPQPPEEAAAVAFDPASPPLVCKVGRGSALFGKEWYDFQETGFYVPRGTPVNVSVARVAHPDEKAALRVLYDTAGQKMIFCPYAAAHGGEKITCSSLYALDDDLRDGIKRTFDIPQGIRGGMISCAFDAAHLQSLAPPS